MAIAILLTSCGAGSGSANKEDLQDGIKISGKVLNPQNNRVVLERIDENSQVIAIDTFELGDDHEFEFLVEVSEPDYYRLNVGDLQKRVLILNDSDLEIVAGGSGMSDTFNVSGSIEMKQIQEVEKIFEEFNARYASINQQYVDAQTEGDMDQIRLLTEEVGDLQKEQEARIAAYIETAEPTIATLSTLTYISLDNNIELVESVISGVEEKYPTSKHLQTFKDQLSNARKLAIGQPAPEIKLPNPEGDTVALSSLRGKVVLIDFWAAWCGPCRKENPNVVRMYNEYKSKGFEIYGVSLDRSRDAWLDAIKADNLGWIHVSDLQYFNSIAAAIYNVEGIPFTVLIDRDGNIIAKNLRGSSLEKKLQEIFG